jgi:hypothetical protein
MLSSKFGARLEQMVRQMQSRRISFGEFIIASDSELSFHPDNRKQQLFQNFFSD